MSLKCNDYIELDTKFIEDWRAGKISNEFMIEEVLYIMRTIDIDYSIHLNIENHMYHLAELLILYRYSKNQSINWIEPIRLDNWSLHSWLKIDPKVADHEYDTNSIERSIGFGFMKVYGSDNWADITDDELRSNLAKEFSFKNLSSIDYIENYLKTYARTKKIRRYLQKI